MFPAQGRRLRKLKRLPRRAIAHSELRFLESLSTPRRIQDFLVRMPINHERDGETVSSPLVTLRRNSAHCLEGALVAALALWMQGHPPLIMDLKTVNDDEDHVVAVFRVGGRWGGITKTNHAVLRYRDPVYRDLRELAMSYFHEYALPDGRKSLRSYSRPYDLRTYDQDWITTEEPLLEVEYHIDTAPHYSLLDRGQIGRLRPMDPIEIEAGKLVEWQ